MAEITIIGRTLSTFVPILFHFAMTPEGQAALAKVKNVGRWYERMAGRQSFQATIPELPSA